MTADLLSDGTLRFMCLLAALYDPEPPSLLCLDEPEVSLHPQLVRLLVSVLHEASERMQIIVATHSPELISYLENADDVVVTEAEEGWSTLKRLSQNGLQHWLEKYSLGELWKSGEIGGRL
jgi:predicted ATPase